ncbi:MAG TPA: hypothetical protein VGC81_09695, partial [Candidatus Methylomirabilis sp.]
ANLLSFIENRSLDPASEFLSFLSMGVSSSGIGETLLSSKPALSSRLTVGASRAGARRESMTLEAGKSEGERLRAAWALGRFDVLESVRPLVDAADPARGSLLRVREACEQVLARKSGFTPPIPWSQYFRDHPYGFLSLVEVRARGGR